MSDCPADEALARFVDRSLPPEERERVAQHLATCEACRLVASLASPVSRTVKSPHQHHGEDLQQPVTLGRYQVVRQVGEGAMGLVYEAEDPTLKRRVALKVLRSASDAASQERLEREARAMAQLSHRNVATVFDVGAVGTRSWVAMEFIEGETLRGWWRSHASPDDRLARLLDAGAGLAAAHDVGLVHRDFKPDNVLVDLKGRTVVTDFGLARVASAETPPEEQQALIGTPAYMSLEQLEGRVADAKSDQFAFCVTAVESFADRRPFPSRSWAELKQRVKAGPDAAVLERVPARLRATLARGLSPDPAARFPSMRALLSALEAAWKAPRLRRRRALLGTGLVALMAVTAWVARPAPCDAITIGDVWSSERRARVESALGKEATPSLVKVVLADLDAYASAWAVSQTNACAATRVRGEQSDSVLAQRTSCLSQRRREFDAVASLLEKPDQELVGRLPRLTGRLPALSSCGDLEALQNERPLPENQAQREAVLAVRDELAKAFALDEAGRETEALALAEAADRKLTELEFQPLRAEAKLRLGGLQSRLARHDEANANLREAVVLATSTRQDRLTARALASVMSNLAAAEQSTAEFDPTLQLAFATLARVDSGDGPDLEELLHKESVVRTFQGRFDEAVAALEKSRAIRERLSGPQHPRVAEAWVELGSLYDQQAQPLKALEAYERAEQIFVATVGPKHPSMLTLLTDRALVFSSMRKKQDAIALHEQALALATELYGPRSKQVGISLANLALEKTIIDSKGAIEGFLKAREVFAAAAGGEENANVARADLNLGVEYMRINEPATALPYFERALATRLKVLGPEHRDTARAMMTMGSFFGSTGRLKEARPLFEKGAAILEKVHGASHPQTAIAYDRLADVAEGLEEWQACTEAIGKALASRRLYPVPDGTRMARNLVVLGRCEEGQLNHQAAKKAGEEALKLIEGDPLDLGEAEFLLAKVSWALAEKKEARAHLDRAQTAFAAAGPEGVSLLAEVQRFKARAR